MYDLSYVSSDVLRTDIVKACAKVSSRLSSGSDVNVSLGLASPAHLHEAHYDWQPRPFDWIGGSFDNHESVCVFKLSLVGDGILCGVLKAAFEKEEGYCSLVLEKVRGNPLQDHPLKKRILDAFCEGALQIAKDLDIPRVDGEDPIPEIRPIYQELGFDLENRGYHDFITLPVLPNTTLNHSRFSI